MDIFHIFIRVTSSFTEVFRGSSSQIRVGDMTSVKISPDSRFALINYAPGVCKNFPCHSFSLVLLIWGAIRLSSYGICRLRSW